MWTSSFWLMTLFWSINVLVFFPNYVINYMMKRIRMNVLILTFTFLCISAWKNHLVVQIQVWWYCHSFCRIVSHKILMAGCCIVSAEPSCQARRIVAFSHFEIGWLVLCPWKTQTNNSWTNWNNVELSAFVSKPLITRWPKKRDEFTHRHTVIQTWSKTSELPTSNSSKRIRMMLHSVKHGF